MRILELIVFIIILNAAHAEDAKNRQRVQWFSHTGGLSMNQVVSTGYNVNETFFVLNAHYNPVIRDLSLPFSFSYSNQKISYSHPFNQFQISPSYKWIKAYIGSTSLIFSPYTLSGHQFNGVGLELNPNKKWSVSAMTGYLRKAYYSETDYNESALHRLAYGVKFERKTQHNQIEWSFFKAKDKENAQLYLSPRENAVLHLASQWNFYKTSYIKIEFASSALTEDTKTEKIPFVFRFNHLSALFLDYRLSTEVSNAYKFTVGHKFLNVSYERVDPNYQTLGAYYGRNDFQNLTLNSSYSTNKMAVSLRMGLEENNIKNYKSNKNRQLVLQTNFNYQLNSSIRLMANYSNFRAYTYWRNYLDELENMNSYAYRDTLSFSQVLQSADCSIHYILSKQSEIQRSLSNLFSFQEVGPNSFFMMNTTTYAYTEKGGRQFNISFVSHWQKITETTMLAIGPHLSYSDSFMDKRGRWRLSFLGNTQIQKNKNAESLWSLRGDVSYKLKDRHCIQLMFSQSLKTYYRCMLSLSYQVKL